MGCNCGCNDEKPTANEAETEPDCFHAHLEHLKRLQGSDFNVLSEKDKVKNILV